MVENVTDAFSRLFGNVNIVLVFYQRKDIIVPEERIPAIFWDGITLQVMGNILFKSLSFSLSRWDRCYDPLPILAEHIIKFILVLV